MRPKNPAGVIVALVFAVILVGFCFALGWGETTRRGIPVWLLGAVGGISFSAVAVQSWRKPRKSHLD